MLPRKLALLVVAFTVTLHGITGIMPKSLSESTKKSEKIEQPAPAIEKTPEPPSPKPAVEPAKEVSLVENTQEACIEGMKKVFPQDKWNIAQAIIKAEGGRPATKSKPNSDGHNSIDHGCFQINDYWNYQGGPYFKFQNKWRGKYQYDQIFDPVVNARVALEMSSGGTYWNPWTTYRTGAYQAYIIAQ